MKHILPWSSEKDWAEVGLQVKIGFHYIFTPFDNSHIWEDKELQIFENISLNYSSDQYFKTMLINLAAIKPYSSLFSLTPLRFNKFDPV